MRKRLTLFTFLFLTILCAAVYSIFYYSPQQQFDRAAEQLFREDMLASTLNMHYTLADPSAYNISEYDALLPGYDKMNQQQAIHSLEEQISFFEQLDPEKLSDSNRRIYDLLLPYLNTALNTASYPYHEEPLSPSAGMQSQLPILLAEYTFRTTRDVEDYLALLSQTGNYFSSLLNFETEKKEAGLLMAASSLYDTAKQCTTIITEETLNRGEHFLQITFQERLQCLVDAEILSSDQVPAYLNRNNTLLTKTVLPAYQNLAKGLTALADSSIRLEGLAARQDGAAYYETLLQSETGCYRSIDEIREWLAQQLQTEYHQFSRLLQIIDPQYLTTESLNTCNELFPLKTCKEMLTDLRDRMSASFPSFPDTEGAPPTIHVKEVSPCLQDYCAPAFYLTPPLDDTQNNTIYINTKTTITPIDLYTTLAHEGFPGHLYQTVYHNQHLNSLETSPVEKILWFGGYLEGWALYTEFLSYDYASEIMEECGYPEYAQLLQVEKHNRSTQLCIYTLLDVLIHHDNIGYSGTAEFLADFGITNSASVNNIYKYIVEEPANYPKYYLGYLEILLLKEVCQETWGAKYSDYRFHKFLLDYGPADFETLNNLVDEF